MSTTLYLRFPKSSHSAKEVEVSREKEVIIGRADDCDINLSQYYKKSVRVVSNHHCKISWRNGRFVIVDLNSTNGTWVNGSRLTAKQSKKLSDRDLIKLANRHDFQVQVQIKRFIKPEDTEPIAPDPFLASLLQQLQKERDVMLLAVAGMGKTTLMSRLISRNETRDLFERYWPNHESFLFCRLDGLAISETTLRAFFRSLIRTSKSAFESWPDEIKDAHELLASGNCSSDEIRDAVITTIQTVQRQLGKRILFLLDHFDDIYPKLPSELFWVLTELKRVEPRVMYVIAMRNEFDDSNQHIHQFLRVIDPPNYYWLPTMSDDELESVMSRYDLSAKQIAKSIELGGKQPRFTVLIGHALKNRKRMANNSDFIRQLLSNKIINTHCGQIWESLSTQEQEALSSVASGEAKMLPAVETHLRQKKRLLIRELEQWRMESPLLAAYVRARQPAVPPSPPSQPKKSSAKEPTVKTPSGVEIRIDGKSIPLDHLTPQEEKLLIYMHSKAGELCSHDDFWEHVWGYDPDYPPSQTSIASLIKNLRKKLNEISLGAGMAYIKTTHGRGYMYVASR